MAANILLITKVSVGAGGASEGFHRGIYKGICRAGLKAYCNEPITEMTEKGCLRRVIPRLQLVTKVLQSGYATRATVVGLQHLVPLVTTFRGMAEIGDSLWNVCNKVAGSGV